MAGKEREEAGSTIGGTAGVQSVEIAFRLIDALSGLGRPAPLREVAKASGMSVSAAHRYLVSLVRVGVIAQEHRGGMYDLGPGALSLGLAALRRLDHQGHALETLDALHDQLGHTVGLMVWGSHGPTIVRWREADHAVTVNARPGHALPVTRSAAGRVFAAFLPPAMTNPYLAEELATRTRQERDAFDAICGQVRKSYSSVIRGDVVPGIDAVATPVFDHDGVLRFVLSVWGSDSWIDVAEGGAVHLAAARHARELSEKLGYAGDYRTPRSVSAATSAEG